MGFLDNSGDIILDAVLTDHGRKVLAKGDGSFQITKFALGDEEINYELFNNTHASGSAYYDLEILQTPILEAFTNNASSMKTKLVTMSDHNLLYLPILKLNTVNANTQQQSTTGTFIIAVDRSTEGTDSAQTNQAIGYIGTTQQQGILFGETFQDSNFIRVDQGLDTTEIAPSRRAAISDMIESTYIIQIDSRLGYLADNTGSRISEDYIDDDHVAFYTVDASDNVVQDNLDDTTNTSQVISGPRGTMLMFKVGASIELSTSTYLFTQLGGLSTLKNKNNNDQSVRHIDSIVRVTGMNTGYSIDIPIRFVKTIIS